MPDHAVRCDHDREARTAIITLDRPDRRNALNAALIDDLRDVLEGVAADDQVRAIVLTGAGADFAAGADIDELRERDHVTEMQYSAQRRRRVAALLEDMPKPSIAAIHGAAVGGGLEIALACTLRVMASDAVLRLPEVDLGIMPGNGGTQRLVRLVGVGRALELTLLGRAVRAEEALRIGMVNVVSEPADVLARACALAGELAAKSAAALAAIKQAVLLAGDLPLPAGIALEASRFALLCGGPDKIEGVTAFREKRAPKFS